MAGRPPGGRRRERERGRGRGRGRPRAAGSGAGGGGRSGGGASGGGGRGCRARAPAAAMSAERARAYVLNAYARRGDVATPAAGSTPRAGTASWRCATATSTRSCSRVRLARGRRRGGRGRCCRPVEGRRRSGWRRWSPEGVGAAAERAAEQGVSSRHRRGRRRRRRGGAARLSRARMATRSRGAESAPKSPLQPNELAFMQLMRAARRAGGDFEAAMTEPQAQRATGACPRGAAARSRR